MSGVNNTHVFVISGKVNFLMIEVITKLSLAFKSKMFQHFFQLFQIKAGSKFSKGETELVQGCDSCCISAWLSPLYFQDRVFWFCSRWYGDLVRFWLGANREYGLKIGGSSSQGAMSRFLAWAHVKTLDHVSFYINPCRPNTGRREKIKLDFYFHASFWCLKRFYQCPKGLLGHHKQGWK